MNNHLDHLMGRSRNLQRQTWFILMALFLVSGIVCLLSLRHNNTTMIKLRDDVYAADKNDGDVEAALQKLRAYVTGHMNTNLSTGTNIYPPIQLQYTYQRLQEQAARQANSSNLYTQAEDYCQAQIPASVSVSGRGRIGCVQDYVLNHGGKKGASIPAGLYEFDFASPTWSPDLAGWSLVTTVILGILALAAFLRSQFAPIRPTHFE